MIRFAATMRTRSVWAAGIGLALALPCVGNAHPLDFMSAKGGGVAAAFEGVGGTGISAPSRAMGVGGTGVGAMNLIGVGGTGIRATFRSLGVGGTGFRGVARRR